MRCFHGVLFDMDGARSDSVIEQEIYSEIEPYVSAGIAKNARGLLDAIKIKAYVNEVEIQIDRIHVNNGTYYLNGCFCAEKEFCVSRLPVAYIPDAAPPKQWLSFLEQLLEPPDIITLQEYISELLKAPRCSFVLYVGRKKLVKRVEFERFISESIEI